MTPPTRALDIKRAIEADIDYAIELKHAVEEEVQPDLLEETDFDKD
jgi:hypothetical protein